MKRAWLYYFPMLFLPNLGAGFVTTYGTIELSDLLIWPYLALALTAADFQRRTIIGPTVRLMQAFVVWALLSTLLIDIRFLYPDHSQTYFCLFKLAKFFLYGFAGLLTNSALIDDRTRRTFQRSVIAAGFVVGIGLVAVGQKSTDIDRPFMEGYKSSNGVSVLAAIIGCYLCGLWLSRKGTDLSTRRLILPSVGALILGSAISEGRGGWIAFLFGLLYLWWSSARRLSATGFALAAIVIGSLLYSYSPAFRTRITETVSPETVQIAPGVGGIDDGGRPAIWAANLPKVLNFPAFGTGFYHRGGETYLNIWGSHNFFLQMFLETGIIGGSLLLVILYELWRLAGSLPARRMGLGVAVKAALVAAIAGGQSGEYFYGGMGLFAVLAIYGVCGSLSVQSRIRTGGSLQRSLDQYAPRARSY